MMGNLSSTHFSSLLNAPSSGFLPIRTARSLRIVLTFRREVGALGVGLVEQGRRGAQVFASAHDLFVGAEEVGILGPFLGQGLDRWGLRQGVERHRAAQGVVSAGL